jgi:DNA (cytosine-5)-methyltransferase 1
MATVTAKADTCVAAPHLMTMRNAGKPFQGADEPTHTVTAGGAGLTCVAASLAQTGYGEREGQNPRSLDPAAPLGTVVAGGVKHAPVAAYMAQHNNDSRRIGGVNPGRAADDPVSTVTASGAQQGVVAASMLSMKGSERRASGADEPARVACTGGGQAAVVAAHVTRQFGASVGHDASEPTGTITTDVNKTGVVAGALVKYYGTGDGQEATEPLHTVTTKDRFCLTRAALAAPPFGPEHHERAREVAAFLRAHGFWDEREFVTIDVATDAGMVTLVMVDIGLRMLIPRELFNAQGFPHGYRIDRDLEGRVFSQSDQVGRAGNSVCPPLAEAITRANVPHLAAFAEAAE